MTMADYLTQTHYFRKVQPGELDLLLDNPGNSLAVISRKGKRSIIHEPLKVDVPDPRAMWHQACKDGRVFVYWATRMGDADELPLEEATEVSKHTWGMGAVQAQAEEQARA